MTDEIRWLRFLCGETSFLLVLQLVLAFSTKSLTLIADAPHAAVDCLTYTFNYLVEGAKVKSQTYIYVCGKPLLPWKVDIGASIFCVLVQVLVTAFIISEAVEELQDPEAVPESIDMFQLRGSVLLFFALISTGGNIIVLLMRRKLKPKRKGKGNSSEQQVPGPQGLGNASWNCKGCDQSNGIDSLQFCPPCGQGFNPFANLENANLSSQDSNQGECLDSQGDEDQMDFSSLLHSVVHPGCDGNHGCSKRPIELLHTVVHPGCDGNHGSSSCAPSNNAVKDSAASGNNLNLNVDSALLHLTSDILRSIVIFIVAVMIKCNVVRSARKADAVCALLVAGFILMGSLAIFQKAFSVFGCRCLGGGHMYTAFIEEDLEAQQLSNELEVQVIGDPQKVFIEEEEEVQQPSNGPEVQIIGDSRV